MTKIMSACLAMFLLCSVQLQCMEGRSLKEKLAIQKERLALCYEMGENYPFNRKQKKAKYSSHVEGPCYSSLIYQGYGDCEVQCGGYHNSMVATAHGSNNKIDILLGSCGYNGVLVNVDGSPNKINVLLNSTCCSSATINLPLFSYYGPLFPFPEVTVGIDGNSSYNSVKIYSWHDIPLTGTDCGHHNDVSIHSPLRKLIWPTITVGLLVLFYNKFFGK